MINKTMYVNQLTKKQQEKILGILEGYFYYETDLVYEERQKALENAMDSRLCDLEEIISIEELEEF